MRLNFRYFLASILFILELIVPLIQSIGECSPLEKEINERVDESARFFEGNSLLFEEIMSWSPRF